MRILSYNILLGGVKRLPRIIDIVTSIDADIVVLCECTGFENPSTFAAFLEATSLQGTTNVAPSGQHVALLHKPSCEAVGLDAGSLGMHHGYVSGVFEFPQVGRTMVIGSHLNPFSAMIRKAELQLLISRSRRAANALIVGDLNTIAPGEVSEALDEAHLHLVTRLKGENGEVDTSVISMALNHKFVDLGAAKAEPTYPTQLDGKFQRYGVRVRLDYMLATVELAARFTRCSPIDDARTQEASDHLPLVAELL